MTPEQQKQLDKWISETDIHEKERAKSLKEQFCLDGDEFWEWLAAMEACVTQLQQAVQFLLRGKRKEKSDDTK